MKYYTYIKMPVNTGCEVVFELFSVNILQLFHWHTCERRTIPRSEILLNPFGRHVSNHSPALPHYATKSKSHGPLG